MSSVKRKGKSCGDMRFSGQVGGRRVLKSNRIRSKSKGPKLGGISNTRSSGTYIENWILQ